MNDVTDGNTRVLGDSRSGRALTEPTKQHVGQLCTTLVRTLTTLDLCRTAIFTENKWHFGNRGVIVTLLRGMRHRLRHIRRYGNPGDKSLRLQVKDGG